MNKHPSIRDEEGQGLAEYGMILGLASIAAVAALTVLGSSLINLPGWSLF